MVGRANLYQYSRWLHVETTTSEESVCAAAAASIAVRSSSHAITLVMDVRWLSDGSDGRIDAMRTNDWSQARSSLMRVQRQVRESHPL